MKRTVRVLLAVMTVGGVMALTVAPAWAVAFTDGSFEAPDIDPNSFVNVIQGGTFGPWTAVKGNINILNSPTFTVSDGSQAAHISGTGAANAGGVEQAFDDIAGTAPIGGKQYLVQYDWTSRCAGSNVRVFLDGQQVDSATNAAATYPTYATRVLNVQPLANTTTLRIDTTTPGGATGFCGTVIDNVRLTAASANPTPAASPASQCSGATGHRVQFRKAGFPVASFSDAKAAYNRPVTDPAVVAQSTHNGVPYINYQDPPDGNAFPSRPSFDVNDSATGGPLTHVAGPGAFVATTDTSFVMRSTGYINVPVAGLWTFTTNTDDGHRLVIGNPGVLIGTIALGTTSQVVSLQAGCYHYALEWFQTTNGGAFATLAASGPGQTGVQLVGDTPAGSTLTVYQGADTPSSCKITAVRRAPNTADGIHDEMDVTISDADGLGGVYNIQATNLVVAPNPAGWLPGLNGPLVVRATKVDNTLPAAWSFTMSDFNGNEKVCT